MTLYRDRGVVLRTHKLAESDRIVVVFTEERGKVRGVAKGVRKSGSRFGARLEPLAFVELQAYAGRELDRITQVETIDAHRPTREDLDRLAIAMRILEAVDQVTAEREQDERLFSMLTGALRAIDEQASPLLAPAFFLKLLAAQGVGPQVSSCARCGAASDLVAFDPMAGGLVCRDHRAGVAVSAGAVDLLQRTLGGGLASVLAAGPSPEGHEVEVIATRALEHHIDRRLRSAHLSP